MTTVFAYMKTRDDQSWKSKLNPIHNSKNDIIRTLNNLYIHNSILDEKFDIPSQCSKKKLFELPLYMKTFVSQLNTRKRCYDMINQYEIGNNLKFSFVIFTRPDLTWYRPIIPWCLWDNNTLYSKSDWAYIIPRNIVRNVLSSPLENYLNCSIPLDTNIEQFFLAIFKKYNIKHINDDTYLSVQITREHHEDYINDQCKHFKTENSRILPYNLCQRFFFTGSQNVSV